MSWQLGILTILALVLAGGVAWFERSRPPARIVAAVAALAALGVAGRVALAPIPNVVATTDVALLAGYTLGGAPGFAVGALSALVSNFWLGQGPWTPWQMAGWGLVGVGGAALAALAGRELGRVALAAFAALAGLLYGALLDLSTMVNFGGEQSLDRYLALSARGIPFNIAHAAGNAALMLAAGPAMVRMLSRYRQRFEVRWGARAAPGAVAAALAALAVAAPLLAPERGGAAEAGTAGVGEARGWLAKAQNGDGGFGNSPGTESSPGMTGWAALGLEAAGRNPLDQRRGGSSPIDYLRRNVGELDSTGDLERTILALEAAGLSSRDFGGRDLIAELRSRRRGNGSWQGQVNLTAFAILAQASAGIGGRELGEPASWLRSAQNRDGGWGSVAKASSEPDSTGAVLQALAVAPGGSGQIGRGARWLARAQRGDGGYELTPGAGSNAQSTAWAVQGLLAAGVDPAGVREGGSSPLDYLAARQAGDGHYAYSKSSDQTPVWVTAQAMAAAARKPFPLAPVARSAGGGGGGGGGEDVGGGGAALPGGGSVAESGAAAGRERSKASQRKPRAREARRAAAKAASLDGFAKGSTPYAPIGELAAEREEGFDAPSTPVLLAGLGLLAAGLYGGWLLYRRRLG